MTLLQYDRRRSWTWLLAIVVTLGVSCEGKKQQPQQRAPKQEQVQAPVPEAAVQAASASDAQRQADQESWQVIYIGKNRIGYVHSTVRSITREGRALEQTSTDTHMTIERFGQKLKIQVLLENVATDDGELVSFVQETRNPPAGSTRVEGKVQGDELRLTTTVAGKSTMTTASKQSWQKGLKAPSYEARLLTKDPLKPGETRSFDVFLPEVKKKATITMTAGKMETVKLFGDESRELLQVTTRNTVLPTATRGWIDEKGNTLKTETDILGLVMTTYEVSEEEAVKAIAGGELDIAVGSLIKVDRIPKGHRSRKVVYEITTPGEKAAQFFVADETQSIKQITEEKIELTVAPPGIPDEAKPTAGKPEFLKSTAFLQSADSKVVEHAGKAAGDETDPAGIARRMEKYVSATLTNKNFSTAMASAAEVARNLEGDCTEHAVLLAAMLRAKKIPSRVSVGLVYIERSQQFGGHMWSEALLNGKWVPLDATLGHGGIGGAHIKMANSSFSDDGPAPVLSFLPMMKVLGKMKIKVIKSE